MSVLMTVVAMFGAPDEARAMVAEYRPRFRFCNTRACDQRALSRRQRRRVQARHKAQVRAERHAAKMRRVVAPYRAWLASTRACESHGRYATATGNGFWGAYQFTLSSWRAAGGVGMPHHASRLEQDYRAVRLLHIQGRGAWPNCG